MAGYYHFLMAMTHRGRSARSVGLQVNHLPIIATTTCLLLAGEAALSADDLFSSKIEPLLKQRCFECHSHEKKIKGGLALDSKSGWEKGGESGPVIFPGKPEASLLIQAVSHVEKDLKMPPKKMLPASEIALLTEWVRQGAPDPRVAAQSTTLAADDAWEAEFQKRLDWWSLKPMRPATSGSVDAFIQAAQTAAGLEMTPQAAPEVLRRRLSFVLTGLPPSDSSDRSNLSDYVDHLLASPHFGEHFARHWMDVVRYTDTYGYEWDNPAKGSHEYRDYLIRAFNEDIGFDQLLRERFSQVAAVPARQRKIQRAASSAISGFARNTQTTNHYAESVSAVSGNAFSGLRIGVANGRLLR